MAQEPLADKHYEFMRQALVEADKARAIGEVPIGAVVVYQDQVIAAAHNLRETNQEATSHAEVLAIQAANQKLGHWRLSDCDLYVTLEPCPMCSGAMILSRIRHVYFGAYDQKAGTAGSLMNLLTDQRFNHQVQVTGGLLAAESQEMLQAFFKTLRQRNKARKKARRQAEQQKMQSNL
ncbi:tRNA adenosine(34) deaminase TadA [Aerococcus kribbianus]|uniref:tRNA-specific adenosine deaminase n=1 Tax=Aerococcus kribbianus TaxID=2999064 RepID=A0A9X3JH45_9LACT|nr:MULTISPECIES: tRNA adenosine(34) deaminase TadA [unclassified Aerococcus]MCZ0717922.1 tRNA adenosine(34) deaminase TadA [Aerococcus sp. YH-aer221]MCZ0726209.1 tRNA adenosine(34) deaminase TadA [Aerococcus sp. YH-aer222]